MHSVPAPANDPFPYPHSLYRNLFARSASNARCHRSTIPSSSTCDMLSKTTKTAFSSSTSCLAVTFDVSSPFLPFEFLPFRFSERSPPVKTAVFPVGTFISQTNYSFWPSSFPHAHMFPPSSLAIVCVVFTSSFVWCSPSRAVRKLARRYGTVLCRGTRVGTSLSARQAYHASVRLSIPPPSVSPYNLSPLYRPRTTEISNPTTSSSTNLATPTSPTSTSPSTIPTNGS